MKEILHRRLLPVSAVLMLDGYSAATDCSKYSAATDCSKYGVPLTRVCWLIIDGGVPLIIDGGVPLACVGRVNY